MSLRETLDAYIAARAAIAAEQAAFAAAHAAVPPEPQITPEARAARRDGIEAVARAGCRDCAKALVDYAVDHEAARKAVEVAGNALRDKRLEVGFDAALAAAQQACREARQASEATSLAAGRAALAHGQADAAIDALLAVPEEARSAEQKAAIDEAFVVLASVEAVHDAAKIEHDKAATLHAEFIAELGPFAKGPGGRPL